MDMVNMENEKKNYIDAVNIVLRATPWTATSDRAGWIKDFPSRVTG